MAPSGRQPKGPPLPSMADVEVEELTLDDEEFDTAFGPLTTQFGDLDPEPREPDPWSSRRRID